MVTLYPVHRVLQSLGDGRGAACLADEENDDYFRPSEPISDEEMAYRQTAYRQTYNHPDPARPESFMLDADPTKPDIGGWLGHRVRMASHGMHAHAAGNRARTATPCMHACSGLHTASRHRTACTRARTCVCLLLPLYPLRLLQVNDGAMLAPGSSWDAEVLNYYEASTARRNLCAVALCVPLLGFVTTCAVPAGAELFATYGHSYWLQEDTPCSEDVEQHGPSVLLWCQSRLRASGRPSASPRARVRGSQKNGSTSGSWLESVCTAVLRAAVASEARAARRAPLYIKP